MSIRLNIVVEGACEEAFVNDVLAPHLVKFMIYTSARRVQTGWDNIRRKPAKGGLLKYLKFKSDLLKWIESDKVSKDSWYSSMMDLYAFPQDDKSPYNSTIQAIANPYEKIKTLEEAISNDINCNRFIPYVQLHEFESFLLVDPDRLLIMYPDKATYVKRLKTDIAFPTNVELINESPHSAPSKRIIRFLPEYEGQKAQVGPLIADDIGLTKLRVSCKHFNDWIIKLESINSGTPTT
jgi:hypothetical protein